VSRANLDSIPLIEFACAALFAGAAARVGFNWDLPAFLIFIASLLALSAIDVELLILPKVIIFPSLIAIGVLLNVAPESRTNGTAYFIAVLCSVGLVRSSFSSSIFASPRALGFGDVRLAPVLGLALGWLGIRSSFSDSLRRISWAP